MISSIVKFDSKKNLVFYLLFCLCFYCVSAEDIGSGSEIWEIVFDLCNGFLLGMCQTNEICSPLLGIVISFIVVSILVLLSVEFAVTGKCNSCRNFKITGRDVKRGGTMWIGSRFSQ